MVPWGTTFDISHHRTCLRPSPSLNQLLNWKVAIPFVGISQRLVRRMLSQFAPAQDRTSPRRPRSGKLVSVPNGAALLEAIGLRKSYGARLVLDGVSLSVNA